MDRLQDLRTKEVIDLSDGRRLGCVCDCEVDVGTGRLVAIVVPCRGGFWRTEEVVIPWQNIKKIGDDIILVESCRI